MKILELALERPQGDREAYLNEMCTEADVRREVESLLAAHERGDRSFLTVQSDDSRETTSSDQVVTASNPTPLADRFVLLTKLGAGGMGKVYEAYDQARNVRVALKTLRRADPRMLWHLKREFRSLSQISHRNLVRFYELFSNEQGSFFTMEFIAGIDFLGFVRCGVDVQHRTSHSRTFDQLKESSIQSGTQASKSIDLPLTTSEQFDRLRKAFAQLAEAVATLHSLGVVHRDIKPSNVMVDGDKRVVILDFGLAVALDDDLLNLPIAGGGTPAYLAPELRQGHKPTYASDWYSVGIMLFEAITGQRPEEDHTTGPPQERSYRPSQYIEGVPVDLDDLCFRLLQYRPHLRLTGKDVLSHLGLADIGESGHVDMVGRQVELARLHDAFDKARNGRAAAVCVHGSSGIGKTELVQKFAEQAADRHGAMVLASRCFEQESVAYKALDKLVDELCRFLLQLPPREVRAILPSGIWALGRLFPVLFQVREIAESPHADLEQLDERTLRTRGQQAFRGLIAALASRRPLILLIDDLQWVDFDSVQMIAELVRVPRFPLLFIGAYRAEDVSSSEALRQLVQELSAYGEDFSSVETMPLDRDDSRTLFLHASREAVADPAQVDSIVEEAAGNPYLIVEMARDMSGAKPHEDIPSESTLDAVLWRRIEGLPSGSQQLLRVLSLCSHPLRLGDLYRAAGFDERDPGLTTVLRTSRLIRVTKDSVEAYHARVHETMFKHVTESDRIAGHRALAKLMSSADYDAELIGVHFQQAGEKLLAAHYFLSAARNADQALAFYRAAEFYQLALNLGSYTKEELCTIQTRLGDALANTGRGVDAAHSYSAAARLSEGEAAWELRLKAAYHLCASGHVTEGRAAFAEVLNEVGLPVPKTPLRAMVGLALTRARIRLRGLRFETDPSTRLPDATARRLDGAWSAGTGLGMVDLITGAYFSSRATLLALDSGDLYRIARSLGWEVAATAETSRNSRRIDRLLSLSNAITSRIRNPYTDGVLVMGEGLVAFGANRFREALDRLQAAEILFAEKCNGASWELATTRTFSLYCLHYLGSWRELRARTAHFSRDAEERGDLYTAANVAFTEGVWSALSSDDTSGALVQLERAMKPWREGGYYVQHVFAAQQRCHIELYLGDGPAAWEVMERDWRNIRGSFVLNFRFIRAILHWGFAAAALSAAAQSKEPNALVRGAKLHINELRHETRPLAQALYRLCSASAAALGGRPQFAEAELNLSIRELTELECVTIASSALFRLGDLLGGNRGAELCAEAQRQMRAQGITNPARMAAAFAPPVRPTRT